MFKIVEEHEKHKAVAGSYHRDNDDFGSVAVFADETPQVADDGTDLFSLLPLEEVSASLDLTDLYFAELRAVPVKTVLDRLILTETGEKAELPEGATSVWSCFPDENGRYIENDSWEVVGIDETINMTAWEGDERTFQLIVGSETLICRYPKAFHSGFTEPTQIRLPRR